MEQLIFTVFIIGVAFFIGSNIEKKHYSEIKVREQFHKNLPIVSSKSVLEVEKVVDFQLVSGSVVISNDAFKQLVASIYNIFGGRISVYETLLDRARREAVLRMKDKAKRIQADIIVNTRFETSKLGAVTSQNKKSLGMFEVLVYGTAIKYGQKKVDQSNLYDWKSSSRQVT